MSKIQESIKLLEGVILEPIKDCTCDCCKDRRSVNQALALLREAGLKCYMACNTTSTVYYENEEDALEYAGSCGVTAGIRVVEIDIIPNCKKGGE